MTSRRVSRRKVLAGAVASAALASPAVHAANLYELRLRAGMAEYWLSQMGYTQAQMLALPAGIKNCGAWLTTARALDVSRLDNPANGVSSAAMNRDYTHYTTENTLKWSVTGQGGAGVYDFSNNTLLLSQIAAACPGLVNKINLHELFGSNGYLPTWLITDLTNTPANLSSRVSAHISAMAAAFPADVNYRIDVVNEITNSATQSSVATDRGWRNSASALYTAQLANGGDIAQWVWDAFTQARAAWPSAKLSWNDFNAEYAGAPLVFPTLTPPYSGTPFASDNSFASNNQRSYRLRYEIWRAKANSVPVDVVGFQYHINSFGPPDFDTLRSQLWDYNRFGVLPAITELNATISGSTGIGPHVIGASLATRDRYAAWVANAYVKVMLADSPCEEVSFWSSAGGTQTATDLAVDYPIRAAIMLAINNAVTPLSRTLKRGSRIDGRNTYPLWMTLQGTPTLSFSGSRTAISGGAGNLQVPWTWYNAGWMTRPISASHLIIGGQFLISAAPAGGTVLIGYGNATSGTPTDSAIIKLNGATLHLDVVVGGVNVLSQDLGTVKVNLLHRVMVRINGTAIQVAIDGGPVQSYTATGSFSDQTAVYVLSNPDNSGTSSLLSYSYLDVHHGPDYPAAEDLRNLSVVDNKICSLGITYGLP